MHGRAQDLEMQPDMIAMPADRAVHDDSAQRAEALFREHQDTVFRYLRAFTGNEDEALDLAAITFERALRELGRRPDDLGVGWLIRTARNAAVDAARQRGVLHRVRARLADRPGPSSPEEAAIRSDRARRIHEAVARLPLPQRDAIALRYSTELTVREIAPLIGKSEAATQKLIGRALDRLREDLHDLA